LFHKRALAELPGQSVLSSPAADDQDFHKFESGNDKWRAAGCQLSVRDFLARDALKMFSSKLMPWDFALILAILGVAVPWRGSVRMRELLARDSLSTTDRLALYASTIAFQWFASGVILWRCLAHHIAPEMLGLAISNRWPTILIAGLLAALLTFTQLMSVKRLVRLPAERQGFLGQMARKVMPHTTVERLAFLALVLTVALCEEFLYRGFVQLAFQNAAAGSITVGILASAAFFSIAHLYQGKRGLTTTFVAGLIFSVVRAWTGSLAPSILAHFATDLSAGIAAPIFFRRIDPDVMPDATPIEATADKQGNRTD
jgi:CAAX protease family protein